MPELPEVETIVSDLKAKISGHKILGVDSDWQKLVKEPDYSQFAKKIKGLIIESIKRRGKNIIINLSGNKALVIHLKMTGHPLVSTCWEFTRGKLKKKNLDECKERDPIEKDPQNRFVHIGFTLDKGKSFLLSDMRKFATVRLVDKSVLPELLKELGPDALDRNLDFRRFKEIINKQKGDIKKVLMNQEVLAGIGNIYSDEILFEAKIHPQRKADSLSPKELRKLFESTKRILSEAVQKRGTSISDFRDTAGEKGVYGNFRRVYRREGEKCPRSCGGIVKRITIAGRSAHFCPTCQIKN